MYVAKLETKANLYFDKIAKLILENFLLKPKSSSLEDFNEVEE